MKQSIDEFIKANALANAIEFNGKANPKSLLGKVIPQFPETKLDMKSLIQKITKIVEEINLLNLKEQNELIKTYDSSLTKKTEIKFKKKDGLPNLSNTEKGVIVRFPPAPTGHLHLGHLLGLVANYEFKKKYGGKFILRFEDTNPDNIALVNYDNVLEDVKWICENNIDEIYYQSDRLEIYYNSLRKLFKLKQCYVCTCTSENFKKLTDAKKNCPHKKLSLGEQKKLFEKFMKGELEGVIRATADINNKNPALRSFALARQNKNPHPRVANKYKVWPNYNLAVTVDDYLMGLTHIIRGKDLEIGEERQKLLAKALGWKMPIYFHFGRLNFIDVELSKTKLSEKIAQGVYTGWDDPRVPSLISHKKRGYKAEAFRKLILKQGISKRDSKITKTEYYKSLDFFNKEILEKEASRYFFVSYKKTPKKIVINKFETIDFKKLKIQKHPEDKSKGIRKLIISKENYIDEKDFIKLKTNDLVRLKHFGNFRILEITKNILNVEFISKEYKKEIKVKSNIQFVSTKNAKKCEIILPDNSRLKGFSEETNNDENLQFERFAFVRFDRKENNKQIYYYTHK